MSGPSDDLNPVGSGNLGDALDHIAGAGFDDDFLTGDDVTIAQIHSLASSKPSGPSSTPPPLMVPEPINDSLPSPSPRTFPEEIKEPLHAEPPVPIPAAALPSPGRTTSNTSSMVSSDAGPVVSPLPKVSPRSNLSSPGRKPKSSMDQQQQQPSSSANGAAASSGTPTPRRPSGGLPRVAMLAANKPAVPKREETTQRKTTPPPFRSGGSNSLRTPGSTSASGRGRGAPGTPGGAVSTPTGASMSRRASGTSATSSPVPGAAPGISRSSSRSSTASGGGGGPSTSRVASTNSRPAWGAPAAGASARSMSARSTTSGTGAPARTPSGTVRSSSSLRTPPGGAAGTGSTPPAMGTRRTVSTSSSVGAGRGRGRGVARPGSPSRIPSGPGAARTTSSTRPGVIAAGAAAATAVAVGTAAAVTESTEEDPLDTLKGLMGEIKDIRHELNMSTPTAADGAENPEFGSAQIAAEESLPGPEFVASVDTGAEGVVGSGEGEDGVVVDSLENKESTGEEESGTAADATGEGVEEAEKEEKPKDEGDTVVEAEEPVAAAVVVEEERPAFKPEAAVEVEQEKIPAKSLCSCSIM